ncbi:MAG: hypothetical protein ACI9JN_000029 [Bacteroidia bacterium]|jgi:hypothetical protein
MIQYKFWNNILGWLSFAIAMVVYTLTVEPSVPLWDCGEFISASKSLQVVHPPGAPLFLLIGRLFSMFAPSAEYIALAVNMLSVVASALTVGFTFWIITHFAVKALGLNVQDPKVSFENALSIFGSGLIGGLALTFMDTFWFSAVEAEVYASSSLFTALSFWGILKWETNKNKSTANRWLVFIAYTIGLSIGLHLLNLLVIPAVVLYYFFNQYQVSKLNVLRALGIGAGALVVINWGLIPGIPKLAAFFDKIFVNTMGLPFNSGVLFTVALVIALVVLGIRYTIKTNKPLLNLVMLCTTFILIGYSSYSMVVIRSLAEPAIDMNDPEDAHSLLSYIQREQYGDRPLFKGPYYNGRLAPPYYKQGSATYRNGKDASGKDVYVKTGNRTEYVWDERYLTNFPRMGDLTDKNKGYKYWYKEREKANPNNPDGPKEVVTPDFKDNMGFMMNYQLGWMYWRYFFWNFGGRQSDIQNVDNNIFDGNWMSGIGAFDTRRIGPQDNIPASLSSNKARNKYYLIPFLLGLIGILFQFTRQKLDAIVVLTLFVFTGMMIVMYLNQPPLEPRERDYTNVGSFQTFCIWIGLAVLAIAQALKKYMNGRLAAVIAIILCSTAPYLMGSENWDDHDRSDRYLGISFAKNYLNSCAPNAILFTNGDNDTYPLWYAQNVEGYRTDVRVINLSLLSTEYYAQALTRKYYGSEPLPLSIIPNEKLRDGEREGISWKRENPFFNDKDYYKLSTILKFLVSDNDRHKAAQNSAKPGDLENYLPSRNVLVPVDRAAVLKAGVVTEADTANIVDFIQFNLGTRLMKGSVVMLDIIATNAANGWERPIYFTTTTGDDTYAGLESYLRHEGLTYRLVPMKHKWDQLRGLTDKDLIYQRLMKDFEWGNMDKGTMFLDHKATLVPRNLRILFVQVAQQYISQGDTARAKELLVEALRVIPESVLPMDTYIRSYYVEMLNSSGEPELARELLHKSVTQISEEMAYYRILATQKNRKFKKIGKQKLEATTRDLQQNLNMAQRFNDSTAVQTLTNLQGGLR